VVFGEFFYTGVVVWDVNTGTRSDAPMARIVFGAIGMADDAYVTAIRDKTRDGLVNRARAGFFTGRASYGYTTTPEPNPADAEAPRMVVQVDPAKPLPFERSL
jgi:hypothetical protein